MKRLGLFLYFDSEGIVDEYIEYLLNDINQELSHLCVIVNGKLNSEGEEIFKKYTDDILFRSNLGFDAGAWKDAMINRFGFDKLLEYDEIILFNDSFFGPLYSFNKIFKDMDNKKVDFWGITVHGEAPNQNGLCPYPHRPRYLQLYFLAFRKNMVKSREFQDYWYNLPYFDNFEELAFKHEAVFTKYFSDLGYIWEPYIETADIEQSRENAISFHTFNMYDMVKNRNLPIIKRKAFKLPRKLHLRYNVGEDLSSTINYIKYNTNYDVSLIYKYFLRTMDIYSLSIALNLKRFIPKYNLDKNYKTNSKVVVIVHIYYMDLNQYIYNYLKNIPDYIDIIITTNEDKKAIVEKEILSKLNNKSQVITVEPRGRDMAGLLVGCKDIVNNYDYLCFMHDKKSVNSGYSTVGTSFRDILWENMLASTDYINSILKLFDENECLGLMVPPPVYHGSYFNTYSHKYWFLSNEVFDSLFKKLNLDAKWSTDEPPLAMGNCFWAKVEALKPLFDVNLHYDDFPPEPLPNNGSISHALERIYAYVAASQRYYTETVMTDEFGRTELVNYQYMFGETISVLKKNTQGIIIFHKAFYVFSQTIKKGLLTKKFRENNNKKINNLKKKLKKKDNKIKEMENSHSWKLTKPLRKLISYLKK